MSPRLFIAHCLEAQERGSGWQAFLGDIFGGSGSDYFDSEGTLRNADGTRSIFDDVDQ